MGQTYPMEQAYQEKRITAAIEHRPIYPVSCAPLIECYAARYANVSTFDFLSISCITRHTKISSGS